MAIATKPLTEREWAKLDSPLNCPVFRQQRPRNSIAPHPNFCLNWVGVGNQPWKIHPLDELVHAESTSLAPIPC